MSLSLPSFTVDGRRKSNETENIYAEGEVLARRKSSSKEPMSLSLPSFTVDGRRKSTEIENIYAEGEVMSRRKSSAKEPILLNNRSITQFAEMVNQMNEAVLLPSKLRDIDVDDSVDFVPPKSDLYQYYQMLNTAKEDLFNGYLDMDLEDNNNNSIKFDSLQSDEAYNSLSSSSSVSGCDNQELDGVDEAIARKSGLFLYHLRSLYDTLNLFSNIAQYITKRYQQEMEASDN